MKKNIIFSALFALSACSAERSLQNTSHWCAGATLANSEAIEIWREIEQVCVARVNELAASHCSRFNKVPVPTRTFLAPSKPNDYRWLWTTTFMCK